MLPNKGDIWKDIFTEKSIKVLKVYHNSFFNCTYVKLIDLTEKDIPLQMFLNRYEFICKT